MTSATGFQAEAELDRLTALVSLLAADAAARHGS
jgi:hypothetical protein